MRWLDFILLITNLFLLMILDAASIQAAVESRKLDESTVPGPVDEKCIPCTSSPPPPTTPSPPPPILPPPSPKKPPSSFCPPPPPSFIYVTGPPGNLYPVVNDFGGAADRARPALPTLIGCGLLFLLLKI